MIDTSITCYRCLNPLPIEHFDHTRRGYQYKTCNSCRQDAVDMKIFVKQLVEINKKIIMENKIKKLTNNNI